MKTCNRCDISADDGFVKLARGSPDGPLQELCEECRAGFWQYYFGAESEYDMTERRR